MAIWLISIADKKFSNNMLYLNIVSAVITIGLSIVAEILNTDYRFMGVLLIVAFYLFRGKKLMMVISLLLLSGSYIQAFSVLAILPIAFYNGKRVKA